MANPLADARDHGDATRERAFKFVPAVDVA